MKSIWNYVNNLTIRGNKKNALFILLTTVAFAVTGAIAWLVLGQHLLPGTMWLICFAGYPAALVGIFGGILYLYNHKFT